MATSTSSIDSSSTSGSNAMTSEAPDAASAALSVPIPEASPVASEQKRAAFANDSNGGSSSSSRASTTSTANEWELPSTEEDVRKLLEQGKTVVKNAIGPEGSRALLEVRQMAQRFIMQHIARVLDSSKDELKGSSSSSDSHLFTQHVHRWLGEGMVAGLSSELGGPMALAGDEGEGETDEEPFLFDVHADEVKEVLIETISRMMLDSQIGELFVQTLVDSQEENVGRVLEAQRLKNINDRNMCYRTCPSLVPRKTVAREVAEEEMIRMLQSVAEGIQSSEFTRAISALVKAELEQSESGRTLRRLASRMKQNGMGRLLLNIISRQVIQSKAGQALTWALIMQEISKSQMLADSHVAMTLSREGAKSSMKLATAAVVDSMVEYTSGSSPNIASYLSWARFFLVTALVVLIVSDISAVIVAVNYWKDTCEHPLQWYWMIMGWLGILCFAAHPCVRLLNWTYGARAGEIFNHISMSDLGSGIAYLLAVKSDWFTRFGIVLAFCMRGGYVLGSVWVYEMSASAVTHEMTCQYTLFFYSWWYLTIVWALHSLAFFVIVGVTCWSYRAKQRLQDGYLPGQ